VAAAAGGRGRPRRGCRCRGDCGGGGGGGGGGGAGGRGPNRAAAGATVAAASTGAAPLPVKGLSRAVRAAVACVWSRRWGAAAALAFWAGGAPARGWRESVAATSVTRSRGCRHAHPGCHGVARRIVTARGRVGRARASQPASRAGQRSRADGRRTAGPGTPTRRGARSGTRRGRRWQCAGADAGARPAAAGVARPRPVGRGRRGRHAAPRPARVWRRPAARRPAHRPVVSPVWGRPTAAPPDAPAANGCADGAVGHPAAATAPRGADRPSGDGHRRTAAGRRPHAHARGAGDRTPPAHGRPYPLRGAGVGRRTPAPPPGVRAARRPQRHAPPHRPCRLSVCGRGGRASAGRRHGGRRRRCAAWRGGGSTRTRAGPPERVPRRRRGGGGDARAGRARRPRQRVCAPRQRAPAASSSANPWKAPVTSIT